LEHAPNRWTSQRFDLQVSNTELREKLAAVEEAAATEAERAAAAAAAAAAAQAALRQRHSVAMTEVSNAAQDSAKAANETHLNARAPSYCPARAELTTPPKMDTN
jgi:septal ring factor EnvC (AmiA/AmiB activator)